MPFSDLVDTFRSESFVITRWRICEGGVRILPFFFSQNKLSPVKKPKDSLKQANLFYYKDYI